jgi:hypothetical protein
MQNSFLLKQASINLVCKLLIDAFLETGEENDCSCYEPGCQKFGAETKVSHYRFM